MQSLTGYATVTQTGTEPLMVSWLEVNNGGAGFYAYNGVPLPSTATTWACGDVRRVGSPSQYTTFKIVNLDSGTARLLLQFFDSKTGTQKLRKTYTLGGGEQLSLVTSDTPFTGLGSNYLGLGRVQATSGNRIVVTASNGYGSGGVTSSACSALP